MAPKLIFQDEAALSDMIKDYFREIEESQGKTLPTLTGLAVHLGVGRKTLYNYAHRDGFSEVLKAAYTAIELNVEQMLLKGEGSTTGAIFWLKNNANWRDKQELEHTGAGGGPIVYSDVERANRVAGLLNAARERASGSASSGSDLGSDTGPTDGGSEQ